MIALQVSFPQKTDYPEDVGALREKSQGKSAEARLLVEILANWGMLEWG